tara:strand:+ start:261 stop:452 length:192 start_codon:yes stop_codon:yes gene_type:complete
MKVGDLVRYRGDIRKEFSGHRGVDGVYIVKRVESNNCWVFLFGHEVPIQMDLMEVISKSQQNV